MSYLKHVVEDDVLFTNLNPLQEFQELYKANHAMAGGFVNSAVT